MMYKPPENTNRVKTIKSKFESTAKPQHGVKPEPPKPKPAAPNRQPLARQLSDPAKRNVKRTPAFRLDHKTAFQRDVPHNRSYFEHKVRQFSAPKPCDTQKTDAPPHATPKPALVKAKSSLDFASIRSKFSAADLYTEPIPRALRARAPDSLVLSRPLPAGPAPRKPPRTFEHSPAPPVKNVSFLHVAKEGPKGAAEGKKDARYMLSRLEHALRHKMRKEQKEAATTTSGEDSDDSVLFRSKSKKRGTTTANVAANISSSLNCLSCSAGYGRIGEQPTAEFFVGKEEPVYAEPFGFALDGNGDRRDSLHYMSTLLVNSGRNPIAMDNQTIKKDSFLPSSNVKDLKTSLKQSSPENSSLSSFTSDLDSANSTPIEENHSMEASIKIKQLINNFETQTSLNEPNHRHKNNNDVSFNSLNRIDELKLNLQKTLDRCFKCEDIDKFHANEEESFGKCDQIIDKFQNYVKTMPKYGKPQKIEPLFDCCIVVGWNQEVPQIKFKFPKNIVVPDQIEALCFPEATSGPMDQSNNAQCYSLVITNDKGERIFGYCRRVIPEGSSRCIPIAYCILSKHRAPRFFKKILMEFESRHGISNHLREKLIGEFYYNKFPRPGESVRINLTNVTHELNMFTDWDGAEGDVRRGEACELHLTLHHDARYEEADLRQLHALPADVLLKIFASLLLERKVILISCVISKLSASVDALQSVLYPFSWPHTFIPILPECLWEVVEAPTPVICGILSVDVVNKHRIENGIVVDLDEGNILCSEGDENSILSGSMKKVWLQGIDLAGTMPKGDYAYSVHLYDAYLRVFSATMKHYKNYICNGVFDKEGFVKNAKKKGVRRFLKWFTETSLFESFIDSVISTPDCFNLFDCKIEMYESEQSNDILTKLFDWNKTKNQLF